MNQPVEKPVSYLIDAPVYVFRAYFSLPDSITDDKGHPVNALYGFAGFLADFIRQSAPEYLAVAFDESLSSSFRNQFYPAYKANRPPAPEDLKEQFIRCKDLCELLNLPPLVGAEFEADDYIGTQARVERELGRRVCILSRDKDLLQLLAEGDEYWDYAGDRRLGPAQVLNEWGVRAEQIVDYLALCGDKVDNIPGVKGVGDKATRALLGRFKDLDAIYQDLDAVLELPVRGAARLQRCLIEGKPEAQISRRLATISLEAPVDGPLQTWHPPPADAALLQALGDLGLGSRIADKLTDALGAVSGR